MLLLRGFSTPSLLAQGEQRLPSYFNIRRDIPGERTDHTYWDLSFLPTAEDVGIADAEWQERVLDKLRLAVRRRMIADVPVGVLLSGGLDSSLLVGLLSELGHSDLLTFSIGFGDQGDESGNEFQYSDAVASHFRTRHRKYLIPDAEVLAALPEVVNQMSEPMVSQDVAAFYLLSQRVSQSVKVVMSGQGADEVFGGYFWYPKMDAEHGTPLERFGRHYFDRDHREYLATVGDAFACDDVTSALVARQLAEPGADPFSTRCCASTPPR